MVIPRYSDTVPVLTELTVPKGRQMKGSLFQPRTLGVGRWSGMASWGRWSLGRDLKDKMKEGSTLSRQGVGRKEGFSAVGIFELHPER